VKVIGLLSAFREGELVRGAIDSLLRARLDDLLVSEGPAGELPEGVMDAPASDYPEGLAVNHGRWRSDARKRDAMLKEAKRRHALRPGEPLWGVWLDGDEVLVYPELLRDRLQAVVWEDELKGADTLNLPLWTKEADGSLAITGGRLVRLDLLSSYDVSVSVVTDSSGTEQGLGNVTTDARLWLEMWMAAVETGRMVAWPPGPGEPCIVHRSHLRHPARRGLRLHRQEAEELRRVGKLPEGR
jgi:hypothetical protein